jgi:hypothetical protein
VDQARAKRGLPARYRPDQTTRIVDPAAPEAGPDDVPAPDRTDQTGPAGPVGPADPRGSRRLDGRPETDADRRFFDLRESGYRGPIDQDGYAPGPVRQQVCPQCGEPVIARPPSSWNATWGPRPGHSQHDGEPLCPVIGPGGYRPADPEDLDGNPVTPQPPATAGAARPTTKEDPAMSTMTPDAAAIRVSELASLDDLELEVEEAASAIESLMSQMQSLVDWISGLADRYTAAPFGTAGMRASVASIHESTPDVAELANLQEALNGLQHEIDEAAALREVAEALDAEGQVEAYRTT